MTPLILILSHSLALAIGAALMGGWALFLMAAASWGDSGEDDDTPAELPTPKDPPCKQKPLPSPSATSTSTSARTGAPVACGPMPTPPRGVTAKASSAPPIAPPATSAEPASSAPPSTAAEGLQTVVLDGGPHDGLALRVDPSTPILRINSGFHGPHRYIATDRFDLNRRVCIHAGPAPLS